MAHAIQFHCKLSGSARFRAARPITFVGEEPSLRVECGSEMSRVRVSADAKSALCSIDIEHAPQDLAEASADLSWLNIGSSYETRKKGRGSTMVSRRAVLSGLGAAALVTGFDPV